jgi:hypothetical protein
MEIARHSIEPGREADYTAFAYELFPLEFTTHGVQHVPVDRILNTDTQLLPKGPPPEFQFIGFDVVSGRRATDATEGFSATMVGFDSSPLSSNMMATEYTVNRYCLIDHWEDAVSVADRFGREEPEPGPYYVFKVWRRRDGLSDPV